MSLKPLDLSHKVFSKKTFGVDLQEVQDFLKIVQMAWEQDLAELDKKREDVQKLESIIGQYRDKESSLKDAVVSAQRINDDIKHQAEKEGEIIKEEAKVHAERMLNQAHAQLNQTMQRINDLKIQKADFMGTMRGIIQSHENLLKMQEGTGN